MAIINLRIEFDATAEDLVQQVKDAVKMLDDRTIDNVSPWEVIVNAVVGDIDVQYAIHECEFEQDDESVADHERNSL